jgi:hypothetical protein
MRLLDCAIRFNVNRQLRDSKCKDFFRLFRLQLALP